jgi:hypothetical protein
MFTRWKLNSIQYGPRLLVIIGILTIGAPLAFYLCYFLLERFGFGIGVLLYAVRISVAAGIGVSILFILLLAIEFAQDRFLDHYYRRLQNRKMRISDESYECQYCGSRNLKASDKQCMICGKDLI